MSVIDDNDEQLDHSELQENNKIVVCILSSDSHSQKTKLLSKLFSDDFFIVTTLNLPVTKNPPKTEDISEDQAIERYRIIKALKHCQKKYPNNASIIIKDNSVSSSCRDVIKKTCLSINCLDYDICYLCVWLDRCDLYKKIKKIEETTIRINKTESPHGLQAVMFSPKGRKIILGIKKMRNNHPFPSARKPLDTELNEQIECDNIKALCTTPNLFSFDVSESNSVIDLAKMSVCRRPEQNIESCDESNYFWIIICSILLLFAIWIVWKRYNNSFYRGELPS